MRCILLVFLLYLIILTGFFKFIDLNSNISFQDISFILLSIYGIYFIIKKRSVALFNNRLLNILFLILIIYELISVVRPIITYRMSIMESLRDARFLLYYISVFLLLNIPVNKVKNSLYIFFILNFFVTILYIVQVVLNIKIFSYGYVTSLNGSINRYIGSFPDYCIIFTYTSLIYRVWKGKNFFLKNYFFIGTLAVIITFTRSMWIGFFIGIFIITILIYKEVKSRKKYLLLSLYIFSFLFFFIVLKNIPIITNRLNSGLTELNSNEGTFPYRINILKERWELIQAYNNKLLGMGFISATSGLYFGLKYGSMFNGIIALRDWDISWASILSEMGLIGVFLIIFIYMLILFVGLIEIKQILTIKSNTFYKSFYIASFITILTYFIFSFTSGSIDNQSQLMCTFIVFSEICRKELVGERGIYE